MKYGKTSYQDNSYFIRKQQTIMSAPRGLYVEAMGVFSMQDYFYLYSGYSKSTFIGFGVGLGYQFLFFNRLALNPSVQLPLTFEYAYSFHDRSYVVRPRIILNISIGYAF
jgi:hypothetical protein